MKKTRVAILFLLLTLFAACLPAAAELPAQIEWPCLGKNRIHNLIGYSAIGNWHHGLYQCTYCGKSFVPGHPREGHSGGTETPTCTTGKTCEKCGAEYGILGHDWDAWTSNGDGTHTRRCKRSNCDAVENESCSGGTGTFTCTKGKTCEKCGAEYGVLGHDWGAWTPNYASNGTHTRRCKRCNAEETGSCSGGYATCDTLGMCNTCGGSYYGGHAWGEWSSAGNGTHTRSCTNYCREVDTAKCTGGKATCTTKAVCEVCDTEYGEKDPNNHDLVHFRAKAPTCTEIGWDAYDRCIRCGYTTRKELPALKHDLKQHAAKAPTCTEIGWDAYEACSRCDYTTRKELTALKHDLEQHAAKAPTCTEKGWNAYETCYRCDYTTYAEQPALNHALVQHDAQAATCTKPGWNAYETCSRCDYTTYAEQPALNHALVNHDAQAPTCTEKGWNTYETCSRCDYTTYAELPALNHDLVQHEAKAPTCTEIGWDAYETCSRCDYTTYAELPALNHDLVNHDAQAPTCTEKGWNAYETCSRCDYTTYAELPALNHDLVNHDAQAPTCTEKGWNAYETCSRCDYTTYAELPALNHDLVNHDAQAPTCTEKGWNAYETCSRCDYTTYAEQPALNHDLVHHDAQAATCTEKGWNAFDTCNNCNYTTYAELSALNHDYQAVTVEPTCETDGYTVFTCSRCKDSYTADPTDKLGHQFGAWSPNGTGAQSADCLRQGCAHTGSTDCRKFTFRTAEGETLTFCPVCGQAENAAQLEKIDAATAWALSGSLSAEDVTARTNGEYLSVAFETAGSLTQPTGRVRLALPAGLLEGKTLVRIAPDGTQTELPFEAKNGKLIFTLDFANSELPVMLFRLLPQTAAL